VTSGTCIFDNGHVQPIDFLKTGQNTSAIHKYARLRLVPVRDEMQSHSTVVYTAKSWLMRFCCVQLFAFLCPRRLCGIMFSPCLSLCPGVCPVPASARLQASLGQHDIRAGKSIPVPTWIRPRTSTNVIDCRAGKSIIQILPCPAVGE